MASQGGAARKAWNEAMKATAGVNTIPSGLIQRPTKRRSDRHKKQERRAKARRIQSLDGDHSEYREAVWADALEGVDPSIPVEVEEEYDDLEDNLPGGGKKRQRKGTHGKAKAGVLPKRFLPRTLASILIEESSRGDGVAREFIQAEARLPKNQQLPPRKLCPVTGMEGIYTDPKSKIPFANLRALHQIQERAPPWMTLGGSAAFLEASKSIREDE